METILNIKNKICIFNDQRILFIADADKNLWFKARDVAKVLEYRDTDQAVRRHVDGEDKKVLKNIRPLPERKLTYNEKNTIFINEFGLFSLIFSSKKEQARYFKRWIFGEVIPAIRKYNSQEMIKNLEQQIRERNTQVEQLRSQLQNLTEKTHDKNLFIILKLFDPESYNYYRLDCLQSNFKQKLGIIQDRHPNSEVILKLEYDPSYVNLYKIMKEEMKDFMNFEGNYFELIDNILYGEYDFLEDIRYEHSK